MTLARRRALSVRLGGCFFWLQLCIKLTFFSCYTFQCANYEGETYRKIAVRSAEHVSQLEKESKQSPLWGHILEHHPEREHSLKFKLSITGSFFDSLSRQADEGERIQSRKGKIMNAKSEFHAPKLNRITVKEVNY